MSERGISSAVIRRLPRYYRYLGELLENGEVRISSRELSIRMKVTASQIRQDLNNFGGFGQQGYGYNVRYLHDEIGKILGLDVQQTMIIIGAGNLGQALANYDFSKIGFNVIGIFDVNPRLEGLAVRGIEIQMIDTLEDFLRTNKVDVAALTVPKKNARAVATRLEDLGIKAIWNFAPIDLKVSDDVLVQNVHLAESLMNLSFNYRNRRKDKPSD
ncbi:MAG: redox-sensing transcriptional repressor Rex [Lachnospiraceae bacterium]|jgi:redox-sensing transcriptional repressor